MTRVVVDGAERDDAWEHLAAADAPGSRNFTVGIDRWLGERHEILAHVERTGALVGVRLGVDSDPASLADDVGRFALIVIEIPGSADGRFFSIAARVREHLRYRGELRVTGDVAPDQLSFMRRCGIDAFELGHDVDVEHFIRRYERFYQSSGVVTTGDNLIQRARRRIARSDNRSGSADGESSMSARRTACLER